MQVDYRKPNLKDIDLMTEILEVEVKKALVLPRSKDSFAKEIRSFWVAFVQDQSGESQMAGFCALQIYSQNLGEIRSLVVLEKYRNLGIASGLIERSIKEGLELGTREFLVLTYRPNLFKRLGFEEIAKNEVPNHKIWADCIQCRHFPDCNEIALLKTY